MAHDTFPAHTSVQTKKHTQEKHLYWLKSLMLMGNIQYLWSP